MNKEIVNHKVIWENHQVDIERYNTDVKDLKLVIVGCCRNVGIHLDAIFEKFKFLKERFGTVVFVFVENDSNDNTLEKLKLFQTENQNVTIHVLSGLSEIIKKRTHRISICRNTILKTISELYSSYDYMLMVDMDDVFAKECNLDDLLSPFRYSLIAWDVMACSSFADKYYDIWALRLKDDFEIDFWEYIMHNHVGNVEIFLAQFQKPIANSLNPIKVLSAFGGAAYYKISSIKGCRYNGNGNVNGEICEHVPFHESIIKKGGVIFIDPQFKLGYIL